MLTALPHAENGSPRGLNLVPVGGGQGSFEIHAAAVAGYQLVLIMVEPNHKEDPVKKAAFRALSLATRLGGEEVHAIVASNLPPDKLAEIDNELIIDDEQDTRRITVLTSREMDPKNGAQLVGSLKGLLR